MKKVIPFLVSIALFSSTAFAGWQQNGSAPRRHNAQAAAPASASSGHKRGTRHSGSKNDGGKSIAVHDPGSDKSGKTAPSSPSESPK